MQNENQSTVGKVIEMRMAKASKDDIVKCIDFFNFIDEFMEFGTFTPFSEEFDDQSIELDAEQFTNKLRKFWVGSSRDPGVECSWRRVVYGCDILIDNVCDPNAGTLEWKPEIAEKLGK